MAESSVDVRADRQKAAAEGKAFGQDFGRAVRGEMAGAGKKAGSAFAKALREELRRTDFASAVMNKGAFTRAGKQAGDAFAKGMQDSLRRAGLGGAGGGAGGAGSGSGGGSGARSSAAGLSSAGAELRFREEAARRTASFVEREKTAAGRAFFDKQDGIRPQASWWTGTNSQWRQYERRRQSRTQPWQQSAEQGAYGALGVGALLLGYVTGEKDKGYESLKQARGALGENIGPLTGDQLIAGNKSTRELGIKFNVSQERRFALQTLLARQTGSNALTGAMINVGKGGLGISAEQGATFAGELQQQTGAQRSTAVLSEFRKAMSAADKAGVGHGRFEKSLAPLLRLYEISGRQRGGDARSDDVAGMVSLTTSKGFRRERAFDVAGTVRYGLTQTGASPLALQAFGAQQHGAAGAWWRSQVGGFDKEAIERIKSMYQDPTAAGRAFVEVISGFSAVGVGLLLCGVSPMRAARRTGLADKKTFGAAKGAIPQKWNFSTDAKIAERRIKLGERVAIQEERAQSRRMDAAATGAANVWGVDGEEAPGAPTSGNLTDLRKYREDMKKTALGAKLLADKMKKESQKPTNTQRQREDAAVYARSMSSMARDAAQKQAGADAEIQYIKKTGRAPSEGEREEIYEKPDKIDRLIRATERNGDTLDAIRRGQDN